MNILHLVSILIEAIVAILGVVLALEKHKFYGWFITLTYAIYVLYDLANFLFMPVALEVMRAAFFVATVSIFLAVATLLREV